MLLRLLLAALCFYTVYQNYFNIEFTVRGLNVYNLLFAAVWLAALLQPLKRPEPAPLKGAFTFLFVMLGWGYLAGIYDNSATWLEDLVELKTSVFYVMMFFLTFWAVRDRKTLRFVLGAVLVTAFLAELQAVRQGIDYGLATYNETKRASGPFGNNYLRANSAAAFFVIFVPVAAALMLELKMATWLRLALLGSVVLGVMALFVTYSRQGYFIMALVFLVLTFRRRFGLAVVLTIALASYQVWLPDAAIQRIEMTQQVDDGNAASVARSTSASGEAPKYDESTESRFLIWAGAWQMITDHPLGVGLNHFKAHIGTYEPRYAGYDSHNNYIRMAAEASLVGALAMALLLLRLLWRSQQLRRQAQDDLQRGLAIAMEVATLGVILGNIYGSRFFDGDVTGNYWVLAALALRAATLPAEEPVAAPAEPATPGYPLGRA
jgi:O-antigen ligase